jgi:hypothetical protein
MKPINVILTCMLIYSGLSAQTLNEENIQSFHVQIYESLQTDPLAIQWKSAETDELKVQKFDELISQIGNPPLQRQWNYPGNPQWPLLDWEKVDKLDKLREDQLDVINLVGVVAQNDQEAAKLSVTGWILFNCGRDMEPWYEKWIFNLAKSQNANLKRLAFWHIRHFGEDIGESDETEGIRVIDWMQWGQTFNQSDSLGKAILLVCMTDLALIKEEFEKVAELHVSLFNGTNDDLKAIALYTGTRKLGAAVVAKWQDIADNHPNPKMKALAQEALGRE